MTALEYKQYSILLAKVPEAASRHSGLLGYATQEKAHQGAEIARADLFGMEIGIVER